MENGTGKKLSEKLSAVFDRLELIDNSLREIEKAIEAEYLQIQIKINPDNDPEIKREIDHHFSNFISKCLKNLKK